MSLNSFGHLMKPIKNHMGNWTEIFIQDYKYKTNNRKDGLNALWQKAQAMKSLEHNSLCSLKTQSLKKTTKKWNLMLEYRDPEAQVHIGEEHSNTKACHTKQKNPFPI